MADIRITPAASVMAFTSSLNFKETLTQEASGSLTLLGSGSTGRTDLFTINGNNGTLFSVSDDLSNSLFSVNTIAGLPVIEAFADNTVVMGQYGQNVLVVTGSNIGIGTSSPQFKLNLNSTIGDNKIVSTDTVYTSVPFTIGHGYNDGTTPANITAKIEFLQDVSAGFVGDAIIFSTTPFSPAPGNLDTSTERMRITSNGNVGINTTNPSQKLEVQGYTLSTKYVSGEIEPFSSAENWSGDVIEGNPDPSVTQWALAYLDPSSNVWYPVDDSAVGSTYLLGIYLGSNIFLLEGHITVHDASTGGNGPGIQSPGNGLPIYIRDTTTVGDMSTSVPTTTGNYVRIMGHTYHTSASTGDNFVMKFRPSNDWIRI
jgi:hypothetical protein